jgi:hypothetical protein
MVAEGGADPRARAAYGFRLAVARTPFPKDVDDLLALYRQERARLAREGGAAAVLDASAPAPAEQQIDLAAWTLVANVLLNLDEMQTKE